METKRKRGRPKKVKLPEEIQTLIKEVEETPLKKEEIIQNNNSDWDVPLNQKIEYFDANLSYELTGYRPINKNNGLDFDPKWFTETRDTFLRTGRYTQFNRKSKPFADFWRELYIRCKYGMTVNGYTITGDHYFFLNFYQLEDLSSTSEAGIGRLIIFPHFMEGLYQWFHYLLMAKRLRLNACMMKAREAGYSQIEAAILAKSYTVIRGSVNVACAFAEVLLDKLLEKVWNAISFLDNNTGGGFSHGRLIDTAKLKKSGLYKTINGVKTPAGWKSSIQGIVVDKPGKLRGDRTDVLMFEEFGLWPGALKAYTLADALVGLLGRLFGIRLIGGTGGESGPAMEGLRKMYYNPAQYGILPFRHNYTQVGDYTLSAFFLPAFKTVKDMSYYDNRGYISDEDGKAYFDKTRAIKQSDPQDYVTYCAEFCYTAEEAFSLEGSNKFNKVNISEQLTRIRALKECPPIDQGYIEYLYKNNQHTQANISGFKWIPNKTGPIKILEHPLWTLQPKKDENGKVIWNPPSEPVNNLYIIGIDGIDIGRSQTSDATKDPSDFCLVVYKRSFGMEEPLFVAIYKDRPNDIREAYKITFKLMLYYNAKVNFEATRQGVFTQAKLLKLTSYFMRRPRATLSEQAKNTNKLYGTPATPAIIDHQTDLIAEYVEDYCHLIWFEEMLDELLTYNDENKRKFDIIAAMAMVLLAEEELSGVVPKQVEQQNDTWRDVGYYTDENGIKRYGVIPNQVQINISANYWTTYDDPSRIRSSDPRVSAGYI